MWFSQLPLCPSTLSEAAAGLNSHICALPAGFCRLCPEGYPEGHWKAGVKDPLLPLCFPSPSCWYYPRMGLHSPRQHHLVLLCRSYSQNQLHHTLFEISAPTSGLYSPQVSVSPELQSPQQPASLRVPSSGASSTKLIHSPPNLFSQPWSGS